MKIAIASIENNPNSEISARGGRAPYYLIFENGELVETFKNPFALGGGGAGPALAKVLVNKGVNLVILGKIGEKMASALRENGLSFEEKQGIVADFAKGNSL